MSTATQTGGRVKPARSIRLVVAPSAGGAGVVRIAVGRLAADYLLQPIPSEIGGRAFQLSKVGPEADGEVYHVLLTGDPRQDSCGCKGFARHSHCKHRDGLAALVAACRL
jgi:hypothetical protein